MDHFLHKKLLLSSKLQQTPKHLLLQLKLHGQ